MRLGLTRRDENRGQAAASTRKQRLGRRSLSPIFERVARHGSENQSGRRQSAGGDDCRIRPLELGSDCPGVALPRNERVGPTSSGHSQPEYPKHCRIGAKSRGNPQAGFSTTRPLLNAPADRGLSPTPRLYDPRHRGPGGVISHDCAMMARCCNILQRQRE